jgi:hypothetical protein
MRGRQYRKSSIKKDSGSEDWMELDWTRQLKNSYPSNSSERKMREATTWKGQQVAQEQMNEKSDEPKKGVNLLESCRVKSLLSGLQVVGQVKG